MQEFNHNTTGDCETKNIVLECRFRKCSGVILECFSHLMANVPEKGYKESGVVALAWI